MTWHFWLRVGLELPKPGTHEAYHDLMQITNEGALEMITQPLRLSWLTVRRADMTQGRVTLQDLAPS